MITDCTHYKCDVSDGINVRFDKGSFDRRVDVVSLEFVSSCFNLCSFLLLNILAIFFV